ncbi:hypothetical protein [Nocardioides humilatus]|uniref:hypothetical protein n=1 Tax=Nocardioides humilatus TaxID=2607660 RepID=UPI00165F4A4D|nr:hypothetical protein [Nocardioides humilatus]
MNRSAPVRVLLVIFTALILAIVSMSISPGASPAAAKPAPSAKEKVKPNSSQKVPAALKKAIANIVQDDRHKVLQNSGTTGNGHFQFGYSVAISGKWAIVGLPDATISGGGNSGEALAFQRVGNDWKMRRNFNLFSSGPGDRFGESVAISGNYAFIGVPGSNSNGVDAGRVEAWKLLGGATWDRLDWNLHPDVPTPGARFGSSVSLTSSVGVIGSPNLGNGAVDLFVRGGKVWDWKSQVAPGDVSAGARFGASLDIDGSYAVIGAPDDSSGAGAAFIYKRSGDILFETAILAQDGGPQAGSHFGDDVAIDARWAAVTQPDWTDGTRNGRVHSYQRSGSAWPEKATITSTPGVDFATAVDVDGTNALVGEDGDTVVPFTKASIGTWTRGTDVSVAPDDVAVPVSALALSGKYALYGSPFTPGIFGESNIGAIGGLTQASGVWSRTDRIQIPSPQVGEQFGYSVAYDDTGTLALVGAPGSNGGAGAAYLFRSNGELMWHLQERFVADVPSPGAAFGSSVAIKGDYAVVGAPDEGSGAAYVFFRDGTASEWTSQARLAPSAGEQDFGRSVAVDGNYIAVGAPGHVLAQGMAVVYLRSGVAWNQQVSFAPGGAVPTDDYGRDVALEGTNLVVGAPGTAGGGAAYVWVRSGTTWPLKTVLTATGSVAGDKFGYAVDISGNRVVVGAPDRSVKGGAFVFTKASSGPWPEASLFVPAVSVDLGWDVAIDEDRVLVGDPLGPNPSDSAGGRALHYRLSGTFWNNDVTLTQNYTNDLDNDSQCGLSVDLAHTATVNAGGNDYGLVSCPKLDSAVGETGHTFVYYP